jgi:hypothetical protein
MSEPTAPKPPPFDAYLSSIGFTATPFVARFEDVLGRLRVISPEEIIDVIIEDAIDSEGVRTYMHLIGFTTKNIVGSTNFLTTDDFTVASITRQVSAVRFYSTDFDYLKAGPNSRINVYVEIAHRAPGNNWTVSGTQENCEAIVAAVLKYVLPNMID